MTPRYEWTPASEPPDTDRDVLVWRRRGNSAAINSENGKFGRSRRAKDITHWRDVEPPKGCKHERMATN